MNKELKKAMDDLTLRASYADFWSVLVSLLEELNLDENATFPENYKLHIENHEYDNNTLYYVFADRDSDTDEFYSSGYLPAPGYWGEWIKMTFKSMNEFISYIDFLEEKAEVTHESQ